MFGKEKEKLLGLAPSNRIAYIPNAVDCWPVSPERRQAQLDGLKELGFEPETLDLKEYFGKSDELKKKLDEIGAVWIQGGNCFVLRRAMQLSGLDMYIKNSLDKNFLYAGFSAGPCVLSPTLKAFSIVDEPEKMPYGQYEIIWDGLGILDKVFMPHYDSDHPESADIDKEIEYCKENGIDYIPLRDGEVLIFEKTS